MQWPLSRGRPVVQRASASDFKCEVPSELLGETNEAIVLINIVQGLALLDTGYISTFSDSFYQAILGFIHPRMSWRSSVQTESNWPILVKLKVDSQYLAWWMGKVCRHCFRLFPIHLKTRSFPFCLVLTSWSPLYRFQGWVASTFPGQKFDLSQVLVYYINVRKNPSLGFCYVSLQPTPGVQCLQKAGFSTFWSLAFKCISCGRSELKGKDWGLWSVLQCNN